jgi:hypothetical protein
LVDGKNFLAMHGEKRERKQSTRVIDHNHIL